LSTKRDMLRYMRSTIKFNLSGSRFDCVAWLAYSDLLEEEGQWKRAVWIRRCVQDYLDFGAICNHEDVMTQSQLAGEIGPGAAFCPPGRHIRVDELRAAHLQHKQTTRLLLAGGLIVGVDALYGHLHLPPIAWLGEEHPVIYTEIDSQQPDPPDPATLHGKLATVVVAADAISQWTPRPRIFTARGSVRVARDNLYACILVPDNLFYRFLALFEPKSTEPTIDHFEQHKYVYFPNSKVEYDAAPLVSAVATAHLFDHPESEVPDWKMNTYVPTRRWWRDSEKLQKTTS